MMTKYDIQSTMEEKKRGWASDYEAFEEFIADGDQLLRNELVNKVDFPIMHEMILFIKGNTIRLESENLENTDYVVLVKPHGKLVELIRMGKVGA